MGDRGALSSKLRLSACACWQAPYEVIDFTFDVLYFLARDGKRIRAFLGYITLIPIMGRPTARHPDALDVPGYIHFLF